MDSFVGSGVGKALSDLSGQFGEHRTCDLPIMGPPPLPPGYHLALLPLAFTVYPLCCTASRRG